MTNPPQPIDDHLLKVLEHLQAIYDSNFEVDSDGDSYVIDNRLRLKLNSVMDKVRSMLCHNQ